mmetsp:Transcript_24348/g.67383  ORF Transcript_24348/g.67383 Transcript_24348/m.67383 type:complete len:97 (+) Transcript_24348:740-1030(+)
MRSSEDDDDDDTGVPIVGCVPWQKASTPLTEEAAIAIAARVTVLGLIFQCCRSLVLFGNERDKFGCYYYLLFVRINLLSHALWKTLGTGTGTGMSD